MSDLLKMPKTPKGIETLNNLLSAAVQVLYERGYYGANVSDITKQAGVATGTFYLYFDSKLSMYRYLLLQFGHSIRRTLADKTRDCKTRRDVERVGLKAWLEYTREHPYLYNIIWESLYIDRQLFTDYYETFSGSYMEGLSRGLEAGEVSDIDLNVLSYSLMGISNFLGLKYCIYDDDSTDLDYVADEAMKLLEGGMFESGRPVKKTREVEKQKDMNFRVEVDLDFLNRLDGDSKEE